MRHESEIRARFPALSTSPTALLDNAGGSQLPDCVIDAATRYLRESFVQVGADYDQSIRATATVHAAHVFCRRFLNARDEDAVVLGSSTTSLTHLIANAVAEAFASGALPRDRDEIIVSSAGHEANVWPWARLEERGLRLRWWHPIPDASRGWALDLRTLEELLGPRTCLVAFPHVSNILGDVWNAREICRMARRSGARSFVDGVAFAPHHLPDAPAIGCDWYVYSTYKVFGPHMAALYGTAEAFEALTGPNHPFIPKRSLPYKFELGGVNHEGAAMIAAGYDYLAWLAEAAPSGAFDRGVMARAFEAIEAAELPLQRRLLEGLENDPRVRLLGPSHDAERVCTVSFVKQGLSSATLAKTLNSQGLGCRYGHFYSRRLVERMGLQPDDGVVRVSLAHYNAMDEVERFLQASAAAE